MFFFFSSIRRHTRWTGDWSSDVCSSDLRLERLAEENRSGSCAPDPVARKHSLAEPIYHLCRAQPVERLAEEVELEIRSPRGRERVRALTQAKTFELSLADLTLAQMGFQRDPLREP